MSKLLEGLNKHQKEAAGCIAGPLLILAGAGSGKTRVLTQRIAYMVQEGIKPHQILAVTFTNKAAGEMKARLEGILGEAVVKNLWVGTFHNICGRILRQDIENYKTEDGHTWQKNFVIFDQNDSLSLIKQALKAENMDEKVYQPKMVQSAISMAKNKMRTAHEFATRAKDYRTERIATIFTKYEEMLAANNAIDFDDMLLIAVNLLNKSPETLEKYHNRFKHILVDEYQDTNVTQYKLINSLYTANKNPKELEKERSLCVVGDVDQSIYSWRGADYKIILGFQTDFRDAKVIKLEQNYRSTENILEAANNIIVNNTERVSKNLYSNKGKGEKLSCFEANDEAEEANYIAGTIHRSIGGRTNYGQFAVLYRTNAQSRAIEEAFMARGIPYRMVGGQKFYDRKEIKDIVAYLKLIYNPHDSQSLKRIINVPKRAIGPTSVGKIDAYAQEFGISAFSVVDNIENYSDFTPKVKNAITSFANIINSASRHIQETSLSEFIAELIDSIGYIDELKEEGTEEAEGRIENLQEFISVAREFEELDTENELGEFLSQVALVSDIDSLDGESESVTLMTLHAAKGLEFPKVFLAGLEEGIFPHTRSLNSNTEMEEERRLMYVGVTRAEELLYLTYAKRRLIWGDYKYFSPSRFISEIPDNLLISNQSSVRPDERKAGGTFGDAIKKLGENRFNNDGKIENTSSFGKNFKAPTTKSLSSSGSTSTSVGFGKNFVAPSKININKEPEPKVQQPRPQLKQPEPKFQQPRPQIKQPSAMVNSFAPTKISKVAKPKAVKKVEQKFEIPQETKNIIEKLKQTEAPQLSLFPDVKQEEPPQPAVESVEIELFVVGERVFHEKFGVGKIEQIVEVASSAMYMVDFGKVGKKALDAKYSKLKKF